ncbi:MAG: tetratricopeptide repeat protein [Planctomycetota bacterium]
MARRVWVMLFTVAALFGGLLALPVAAREGEDENPFREEPEEKGDEAAERRALFRKMRPLLQKVRRGEKLTEEERDLLNHARRRWQKFRREREERAERPRRLPGAEQQAKSTLRRDERLNVRDRAYYQIAELHIRREQYTEAATALHQLVKNSKDPVAVSLTHLNLGDLYRERLGNTERAVEEYRKVTGEFVPLALRRLVQLFEEVGKIDAAVAELETLVKTTDDKLQKVLALQQLADLLERNGREDEAVATLQQLIRSITHDEAEKISKLLDEARARHLKREEEQNERLRIRKMREWREQVRRKLGAVRDEMRPREVRPRGPKKRDAEPHEEPIRPAPDRDEED